MLLDGFKAQARTILEHKMGRDEAEEMISKKYDTETAMMIEASVTDCVMQVGEITTDLAQLQQKMAIMEQQQEATLRAQQASTPSSE